ncbi:MAG: hypothetical protein IKN09_01760, partial [Clostridia bacterium]|nr:hypothetical protein [Clostridia bacterium]
VTDKDEISKITKLYVEKYFDIDDDKQTWFDKMKDLAEEVGFAREVKEFKANPENWPGHVGDISTVIRVTLTGRQNTPDLYEIMQVLGQDTVVDRLSEFKIGDVFGKIFGANRDGAMPIGTEQIGTKEIVPICSVPIGIAPSLLASNF